MSYPALKFIRPFVKVSSYISPRFTGNFAFRLFCKPPKVKNLDGAQLKLIQSAQDRMSEAKLERITFDGGEVQTYRFATTSNPSRGTILMLHGWSGRAAFMSGFTEGCLRAGFDVLSVDLPGHGESAGTELHIPLALKALDAVHRKFGPWKGIIAHSFGGAISLAAMAGAIPQIPAIPVNRLVLIATPHSVPELFDWFSNAIGLTNTGTYWFKENVKRLSGRPLETFEGLDQLRNSRTPTLILHAPDDKEVSFTSAEILATAGDHVRLIPLPKLGHRRILYAKETVAAAISFITAETTEQAEKINR